MCILRNKTKRKSVVGYKYALKTPEGDIISPATGIVYKKGKVPKIKPSFSPKYRDRNFASICDLLTKGDFLYNHKLYGKTSVFKYKKDAVKLASGRSVLFIGECKSIVIKMKISGTIWTGIYESAIFAGDYIEEVEEVKFIDKS